MAVAPDGRFGAAWFDGFTSLTARLFDAQAAPTTADFEVEEVSEFLTPTVDVAMNAAGVFLVVWEDTWVQKPLSARAFASDGLPLGGAAIVATRVASGFLPGPRPSVAAGHDGNFLVAWSDGTRGVFARLLAPNGAPIGAIVDVGSAPDLWPPQVSAAADPLGGYAVVWARDPITGPPVAEIRARRLSASGIPMGPDFPVTDGSASGSFARHPSAAFGPGSTLLVVWTDNPDETAVVAGRSLAEPIPLLTPLALALLALFAAAFPSARCKRLCTSYISTTPKGSNTA
jgi:hypothetical protein